MGCCGCAARTKLWGCVYSFKKWCEEMVWVFFPPFFHVLLSHFSIFLHIFCSSLPPPNIQALGAALGAPQGSLPVPSKGMQPKYRPTEIYQCNLPQEGLWGLKRI